MMMSARNRALVKLSILHGPQEPPLAPPVHIEGQLSLFDAEALLNVEPCPYLCDHD